MKKAQTSREQGMAMISNWKISGMNCREFCSEQSIPYHRLQYWLGVYNRIESGEGKKGHNKFIPVSILTGILHRLVLKYKHPVGIPLNCTNRWI